MGPPTYRHEGASSGIRLTTPGALSVRAPRAPPGPRATRGRAAPSSEAEAAGRRLRRSPARPGLTERSHADAGSSLSLPGSRSGTGSGPTAPLRPRTPGLARPEEPAPRRRGKALRPAEPAPSPGARLRCGPALPAGVRRCPSLAALSGIGAGAPTALGL